VYPKRKSFFGIVVRRMRRVSRNSSYVRQKPEARVYILALLEEYATRYSFAIRRVAIRDTRRRWGSCSATGNLNFSYKLLFLPPCIARYIVVHELCHLRQLNHGPLFWQEVATIMPDYQARMDTRRHHERTAGTSIQALTAWQKQHDVTLCPWCIADASACV